jgi:ankyrin repeat protein
MNIHDYLIDQTGLDWSALLLANNAEVNARAINGNTPLHLAVANGHEDVAELLRQHGSTE